MDRSNAQRRAWPWTQIAVGALGASAVVALVLLSLADLGDPTEATRGRLVREAAAELRLLEDAWEQALRAPEPPATGLGMMLMWTLGEPPEDSRARRVESPSGKPDAVGAAFLQLAKEHQVAGRYEEAQAALDKLWERVSAGPLAWEGRVQAVRLARASGDAGALRRAVGELERVPWGGDALGSQRLRGVLAAAPGFDASDRQRLAAGVVAAFDAGELRRDSAQDKIAIQRDGLELELDGEWVALRRLLQARLPLGADAWARAIGEAEAGGRELLGQLGPGAEPGMESGRELGRWHLIEGAPVPAGMRLGLRFDEGTARAVLLAEGDLLAAAEGCIEQDRGWLVGREAAAPAEALGAPIALEGLGAPVRVIHRDPAELVRLEKRRLDSIRLAMGLLAGLIGLATWLGIRSLRRMARLAELRSTFVASVSHDLRTPLASISNLAENLEDGVVAGEHALREYHGAIRREAARLGRIVNGLLDFASIERGEGLRLRPRAVDAAVWTRDLEASALGHCRVHGVRLSVERGALPSELFLDPDAVHRAVLNLVENAVRHSGESDVRMLIDVRGDVLHIQVVDRGRGLPASVQADLFQPYARGGESGGTGLGLTIVRRIAEAHGGTARVEAGADGAGLVASLEIGIDSACLGGGAA